MGSEGEYSPGRNLPDRSSRSCHDAAENQAATVKEPLMLRATSPRPRSRAFRLRFLGTVLAGVAGCTTILGVVPARSSDSPPSRTFDLEWTIQVEKIPPSSREARVWIAVPQELPEQKVSELSVKT